MNESTPDRPIVVSSVLQIRSIPVPIQPDTDATNALRFVQDHGENVRYVIDWKSWVVWDGKRWSEDRDGVAVQRLVQQTAAAMRQEAREQMRHAAQLVASSPDDPEAATVAKNAKRYYAWSTKSEDLARIKAASVCARVDPNIAIPVGDEVFDRQPHLLNAQNGTIDLKLGTLRPHCREDYLTKITPYWYDAAAKCPWYERFLSSLFPGKAEVAEYVHQLSGYTITGETREEVFSLLVGNGSNGKTILLNLWQEVLGRNYCYVVPHELLMTTNRQSHPTVKVGLRGARLACVSETEEDGAINEQVIKSLASTDSMSARRCGKDWFEFRPSHKLFLATNHRPRIRETDNGIWRRVQLIDFARKFWKDADKLREPNGVFPEEDRADLLLSQKFASEYPGILAAMVQAARQYYAHGLTVPACVMQSVAEYRADEDILGTFITAMLESDLNGQVPLRSVYAAYLEWSTAEGNVKHFGKRKLAAELRKSFGSARADGNMVHFQLRIKPNY